MPESAIVLGANQYGKAEVRLVRITRDTDRHEIEDLNVTSQLRGDLDAVHVIGDNAHCVPTDTQKNTVYALAKDGVGAPEDFLLRLGQHFVDNFDWIDGGRWAAEKYTWSRIPVAGEEHNHSFVRGGTETRTAVVTIDDGVQTVITGLQDLAVLKSTASEFVGFTVDKFTTLAEATDRILATSVTARWSYNNLGIDYDAAFTDVRRIMLEAFATTHSLGLQHSLYQMGKAVLEAHEEIDEIRFSMPNLHHFKVDLSPFGLDNPDEVFFAADRPYGLIEAAVKREGAADSAKLWASVAGFC